MSCSPRSLFLALASFFAIAVAADAATVTGTVRARSGAVSTPLQGATVQAYDTSGVLRGLATTDATGLYRIDALPAGSYRFLAFDPTGTYATAFDENADSFETTPVVTLSASSNVRIDFELVAAGSIGGTVISAAGAPLAGMVVEAYNVSGTRRGFTTTAADGSYNLTLPPGEFRIVAYDPAAIYAPLFHPHARTFSEATPVTVSAGAAKAVTLSLPLAASFGGVVVEGGTGLPLAAATVYAYTPAGALVASRTTDASGRFSLPLPPGDYRFVAADPAKTYATTYYSGHRSFAHATVVTLVPGEVRNVQMALARGGIIAGRIVAAASSSPLAGVTVAAYNVDGTLHATSKTAADGTYELVVAPGEYRVAAIDPALVYAPRFYAAWNDFRFADRVFVSASQRVSGIDVALERAGRISGVVTSASSGQPLAGITVISYDSAGLQSGIAKTAADGRYTLVVAPGSHRLLAFDDQLRYATAYAGGTTFEMSVPLNVSAGASVAHDFALSAGLKITGTVTNEHGQPLDGIEIFALDMAGNRVGGATSASASGAFALAVPAGNYKFVATDPAGRYRTTYYDRVGSLADARVVAVTAGQIPPPIAFALESAGGRRRSVRH